MQVKRLKVLFIVNIPSPYRVDFFNELGKFCDLTVLFERDNSKEREGNWYNNNFKNFKGVFLYGKDSAKKNAYLKALKYLKRSLFDIFIVGGYSTPIGMFTIEILKLKKIPFVLNTDGGMIKQEGRIKYFIKKHFISSASFWLSSGKQTTDYLVNYGANSNCIFAYPFTSLFSKDILVNPIKIDLKNKIKSKLNINEEKVILSIGRFIDVKGFDILLKCCGNLPKNYGIYIVGGEPTRYFLEIKNNLKLTNVHFIGFKSKEDLNDYYLASDIFVLPTRGDIWGLVVNEAMANGLPVITTNKCIAGLELIVNNINGFIVPVNNTEILTNKIIEVTENGEMLKRMSKNNIEKIQTYSIENMAYEHMNIFNTILNKGNKNGK
ncbi:glycosyltransferase family 4 protein [Neobacillus mesonae]|uniref:Glycosyl transferase family 1 domain-containing protein n=1 Tax=Neobacillus mesonae TaxID=1193713 RepID=A0A3Q9R1N9_9BACI|nr:glycosyltransferase family 4 protein [Neobacillus mesonae]AZU64483.1 hypothetical protein CHR53_26445 [Neobacillus mesonae]